VAESLTSHFVVYGFDRRGHGLSGKPKDAYHFQDFTEDLLQVIDCLELRDAYGVGHSSGATDLLLAAASIPAAFKRIFAIEPTVMDFEQYQVNEELRALHLEIISSMKRRRAVFPSYEKVLDRYRTRPAFLAWQPELLELYVHSGFEPCSDGSVQLLCTPLMQAEMDIHICAAHGRYYAGDSRGNPFEVLASVELPACIASTEYSSPIYKEMAKIAARLIPAATSLHFNGVGHCVAQESPDDVTAALLGFWQD
jgi:pimeloyl-ACP methyl ester carboxylesterase